MVPISMPCGPRGFPDLTMKHMIEPQPRRPTARGPCFLRTGRWALWFQTEPLSGAQRSCGAPGPPHTLPSNSWQEFAKQISIVGGNRARMSLLCWLLQWDGSLLSGLAGSVDEEGGVSTDT